MLFLAVTAETWIVTGLGFGIVLVLLFCLVYILQFFGWIMQKVTAPRKPKEEKKAPQSAPMTIAKEETKPVSTPAQDEMAAIAYALYLAQNNKHDFPTAMISIKKHETAWNEKSIGLNNVGF